MRALLACAFLVAAPPQQKALSAPWKQIAPGVETATVADLGGDANWAAKVVLVDPLQATFAVRFDPARPTVSEWRARYPDALAILDGSFYSADGPPGKETRPTCDVIEGGKLLHGAGCHVKDALYFGAHGSTAAKSADPLLASALVERAPARKGGLAPAPAPRAQPSLPRIVGPAGFRAEEWTDALKSFPALVHEGHPACSGAHYCLQASRTAALAQLRDGKIVLFASQWPAARQEVGRWLAEELGAVEALNLDGGPEATLALRGEPLEDSVGTQGVGLPLVLLLLPADK